MNKVELVVTGQDRSKGAVSAPKKELSDLEKAAVKATSAAKGLNEELADGLDKRGGMSSAEQALAKLSKSADEAFDNVKTKMEEAFQQAGQGDAERSIKIKAEIDKENLKNSVGDALGGIDFFGGKDVVRGGLGGKLLEGILKGGELAKAGATGAANFVTGLGDGLKNQHPAVQAAVYGTLAVAIAAAAPLAGGALAGGLIAGFGAGIGGIGIAAAAQSIKVRESYSLMWDQIVAQTKQAATPLEKTLIDFSGRATTTFAKMRHSLAEAFVDIAPGLDRLGDGLLKSIGKFEPALRPLASAATAVFSDLGDRLPDILGGMADAFSDLADEVAANPEALGDFIALMGEFVEAGTFVIQTLNYMHEGNKQLLDIISTPLEWVGLKDGADEAKNTSTALEEVATASYNTQGPAQSLNQIFDDMADSAGDVASRGADIVKILDILSGRAPGFEEAAQGFNDVMRDISETFGKTGAAADGWGKALINADGTVNTTTENGSKLQDMMGELQSEFANMAASTRDLEASGMSHDDAVKKVTASMQAQRDQLIENAWRMGLTKDQMRALLDTYGLNPKNLNTIATLDDAGARGRLADLLTPRTLWIEPRLTATGIGVGAPKLSGPNKAHAVGGPDGGGWMTVGEMGPERVKLPPGAQVYPATRSQPLLQQQSGGGGQQGGLLQVNLVLDGKVLAAEIIDPMKGVVRTRGGDPGVFG